jgi:hypothetical protein
MEDWKKLFQDWKQENKLLNVEYLIIKRGKFSFSGRLIQFQSDSLTLRHSSFMLMIQNRLYLSI